MNPFHAAVSKRASQKCEYCRAPENIFNSNFEVDHITPVALGGTNDHNNFALACPACNVYKSNATKGFDAEKDTEAALFHPRTDVWSEHFRADTKTGIIQGLTPIGRATVARLQINHPIQLEARLLWIQLGLYP